MQRFPKSPPPAILVDDAIQLSGNEIETVIQDVLTTYGYDFTNYSRLSFRRRVSRLFHFDRFGTFEDFRSRLRTEARYFSRFLEQVTVNATEMFRDASFYRTLRDELLPALASLDEIRIWHAGCSTGQEVFSMAILLHEAGLLEKARLFATDINPVVLEQTRVGSFPIANIQLYEENYLASGGQLNFSSYYTRESDTAVFADYLASKTTVSPYNLVSGKPFNEFHLIMCRNVLIYFDKPLQDEILQLFRDSLAPSGFLALGAKETLKFTRAEKGLTQLGHEKIWQTLPLILL